MAHFAFKSADISPKKILSSRGLDENGRVQEYIDQQCLELSEAKIPKDQNFLINSGIINTKIGSGFIKWNTKYARRLYYHPEYNFSESPERGAYWFERMKQQHGAKIRRGAAKIAGGKTE